MSGSNLVLQEIANQLGDIRQVLVELNKILQALLEEKESKPEEADDNYQEVYFL